MPPGLPFGTFARPAGLDTPEYGWSGRGVHLPLRRLLGQHRRLAPLVLERLNGAGAIVAAADVRERRLVDLATGLGVQAAGVEPAARRRVDRARDVPRQDDPLPPQLRVRDRHRREQRLRVGLLGGAEWLCGIRQ